MGDFYQNAVNNPFEADKSFSSDTKKRGRGRPKNTTKTSHLSLSVSEDYGKKIDRMRGMFGPTRSAAVQYILQTFFESIGEEGFDALVKANHYGNLIEKRKQEDKARRAFRHLQKETVLRRSGGWLLPTGESAFKNLEAQWEAERTQETNDDTNEQ